MSAGKKTTDDHAQVPTAVQADRERKRLFTDAYPEYANCPRKRSRASGSSEENTPAHCDPVSALMDKPTPSSNDTTQQLLPDTLRGSSSDKVTMSTARPLSPPSTRVVVPNTPRLLPVKPFIVPAAPQPPVSLPKFPSLVAKLRVPDNSEAYEEVLKQKDELQRRLDAALHENKKMRNFMEEVGMRLIKGPYRP